MALKNQAITVCYVAWNTSTNAGQPGDAANHTLKLVQDGTEAAPTNAPAQVDATNAPGVYSLALTAADMNFNCVALCGKSSTANVAIIPLVIVTERGVLPTVAPATAGGFVTVGTGSGQLTPASGGVNVSQWNGVAIATPSVAGVPIVDVWYSVGLPFFTGTAQAGGASTITLSSTSSSIDNYYLYQEISINGGTGIDQQRIITGYVGATKVATVNRAWTTNPDNTSVYSLGSSAEAILVLTQALSAARAIDAIADTALTLNDGFHCAIAAAAGKEDVSSGTSMIVKTPSTGTVLRTFTITTAANPFAGNVPVTRA